VGSVIFLKLNDLRKVYSRISLVNRHIGHILEAGDLFVVCSGAGGVSNNNGS
jgi:hypothetical protein